MINLILKHTVFKALFISVILFVCSISVSIGQIAEQTDTLKYKRFIPDYVKLQYAGGIGFISTGVGYTFLKNKLDISLFYSYIPDHFTVYGLHSISLQFTGKLLKYQLTQKIEILPLNIGFFTHHTFGGDFWVIPPEKYSKGYYWWYPGVNAGMFIGGEIKTKLFANKSPASGTAFYARFGTRGLYIASKIGNSTIPVTDIIEVGFGVAIYR